MIGCITIWSTALWMFISANKVKNYPMSDHSAYVLETNLYKSGNVDTLFHQALGKQELADIKEVGLSKEWIRNISSEEMISIDTLLSLLE